jgi:hypothetical protein
MLRLVAREPDAPGPEGTLQGKHCAPGEESDDHDVDQGIDMHDGVPLCFPAFGQNVSVIATTSVAWLTNWAGR